MFLKILSHSTVSWTRHFSTCSLLRCNNCHSGELSYFCTAFDLSLLQFELKLEEFKSLRTSQGLLSTFFAAMRVHIQCVYTNIHPLMTGQDKTWITYHRERRWETITRQSHGDKIWQFHKRKNRRRINIHQTQKWKVTISEDATLCEGISSIFDIPKE